VFGSVSFHESSVTGTASLGMLEQYLMPILQEEGPSEMPFQQDGEPLHLHHEVTDFPDRQFPGKWIDRASLLLVHLVHLT